jgi:hypothetical protein
MAAELTRLTHKIAIQLHLMAFAVLAPGSQSGNFGYSLLLASTISAYFPESPEPHGSAQALVPCLRHILILGAAVAQSM